MYLINLCITFLEVANLALCESAGSISTGSVSCQSAHAQAHHRNTQLHWNVWPRNKTSSARFSSWTSLSHLDFLIETLTEMDSSQQISHVSAGLLSVQPASLTAAYWLAIVQMCRVRAAQRGVGTYATWPKLMMSKVENACACLCVCVVRSSSKLWEVLRVSRGKLNCRLLIPFQ